MSGTRHDDPDDGPEFGTVEMLTWLGDSKGLLAGVTAVGAALSLAVAFLWPPTYTARTTLLPPGAQQTSGSAAALATLGALGALPAGLGTKTPDELYVALLKSDSILRDLDQQFKLQARYDVKNYEALRKVWPKYVSTTADKKSGVITVEVDDDDPQFAARLANAHATEVTKVLGRLAVSEAQQRRVFFEQQVNGTKEKLIVAEQNLRRVQERSGVIVLDKQAEALIGGAAQLRALIAEREVQLKVLKTSATEQNPDVMRMNSELAALRNELSRVETTSDASQATGSAVDIPVGRLPEAALDYIRARREMKLQETLLENVLRQYEVAKLDEAKEGQVLQQIDKAVTPDYKSKPPRALIFVGGTLAALLLGCFWVIARARGEVMRERSGTSGMEWDGLRRAWRLRG